MIQSLLIANRGEIACRIIRTARAMGIRTVAVYSDADANALHLRDADEAVHIGPSPARDSYLVGEKIIAAAKATGAQAIHPGYGFLSENAAFAQSVIDAGLIWVGPNPSSITAMGLKDAAKKLMQDAGVPTTPGYLGDDQSLERLTAEADAIGYPVLIKAVAGGGGKGMRKVDSPADFADALTSCRREAASSFGNDSVLLENWITNPRHIEVQVFGDSHGNVVHLFERDCSLQRRHQKVIEEAPAPGMTDFTRAAICDAAVRAAKAVDYVGAGTIEFIADGSAGYIKPDRVWFMEMNTRLQVEHPVTEEITGQDLVEWQLRVASGEPLPKKQHELSINGHAIEARLYAEDPAKGFLPSTGTLEQFELDANVRIDKGVYQGAHISPYYDPMIAKMIAHGRDREEARETLAYALGRSVIWPLRTNAAFLINALDHPDFIAGTMDTGVIERAGDMLISPIMPSDEALSHVAERYGRQALAGFRLNARPQQDVMLAANGQLLPAHMPILDYVDQQPLAGPMESPTVSFMTDEGQTWQIGPMRVSGNAAAAASDGAILSPMPGRIIAVAVAAGDSVTKGQKLLTLEAMKMEHSLVAPFDGVVAELNAAEGGQVSEGALLAKIDKEQ
ncbi:acetyl/propionyl/methylcrotonyl-CoA carboxylase subunit alpha [Sphingobium cupriresistens]|uniref:Acetyl/propionyl/methylcrotonyl-CoA carboxylase subunit alpha n=1 Tax=Sphingobium cupriresistens TaxID=1132417 RepID=A0A8G1ZIJ8_9SPHN|nr:acetyl/propionyl/methylcrotonyl-CoA carboxylase subunit alpha [Sphingobium cupriresistens]RYM13782.1 acetyl/propionyl/methylcrotonyl-CoA carboxylase subunit alpha [Sphingobium cupriresistens]